MENLTIITSEIQASETQTSEIQVDETQTSEIQVDETQTSETQTSETQTSEIQVDNNVSTLEWLESAASELNTLIGAKAEYSTIVAQTCTIEAQIKEANNEITSERISKLLEMDTISMFNDFIDNHSVIQYKLSKNVENGTYSIGECQRNVSFIQLDNASKKEICKGIYIKLAALFMDNLYRSIESDLTVEGVTINPPALNSDYQKLRIEHKFDGYSTTQLEKQLNTILEALLPAGITIKAVKADVKYLKMALTKVKGGTLTIVHEKTFINEIFTMLYCRKNNVAYQFVTKMNAHKAIKQSVK